MPQRHSPDGSVCNMFRFHYVSKVAGGENVVLFTAC